MTTTLLLLLPPNDTSEIGSEIFFFFLTWVICGQSLHINHNHCCCSSAHPTAAVLLSLLSVTFPLGDINESLMAKCTIQSHAPLHVQYNQCSDLCILSTTYDLQ